MSAKVILLGGPTGECDFCGKQAELRPYGPNKEYICFKCGMEYIETTEHQFEQQVPIEMPEEGLPNDAPTHPTTEE